MATMIGLFSSIGEHIPIFRKDKIVEASAEGTINRSRPRSRSRFRSRSKVTLILKNDMQLSNSQQYDLNLIYVTMKKITLFLIL